MPKDPNSRHCPLRSLRKGLRKKGGNGEPCTLTVGTLEKWPDRAARCTGRKEWELRVFLQNGPETDVTLGALEAEQQRGVMGAVGRQSAGPAACSYLQAVTGRAHHSEGDRGSARDHGEALDSSPTPKGRALPLGCASGQPHGLCLTFTRTRPPRSLPTLLSRQHSTERWHSPL